MTALDQYFEKHFKTSTELLNGRSVQDGYIRSVGLQFGELQTLIGKDPLFRDACAVAHGRTIISGENRMNLYLLIKYFLPRLQTGHIIEFGAYKGGNSIFMAYVAKALNLDITIYCLDTFTGMPKTDPSIDLHTEGDFNDVDFDELKNYAHNTLGLTNISFVQGLFSDTAESVVSEAGSFSLVHIDCDIASGVEESYEAVKNNMVEGGYIAFDDALFSSCLGATVIIEDILIRRDGLNSEQIYPHYVFRNFDKV